jgi:hypothetical protein
MTSWPQPCPASLPVATPAADGTGEPWRWLLALVLLAAAAAATASIVARRRRRQGAGTALRPAVERLRQALAGEGNLAEAFAALLAARLGCPPAAIASPDLPLRLRASGIPAPLANRAAHVLEELRAARRGVGGGAGAAGPPVSKAALTQLAAELVGEAGNA